MANWFIAFPVAADVWFGRVDGLPPRVRRFAPEDLHLTIAFLGAVGEAAARRGWDALIPTLATTTVTLGPIVPMGDPRKPSALSAELVRGRAPVEAEIARTRDAAFEAAGARRETRPVRAHVTVARPPRDASHAERAAAVSWASAIDLGEPEITLDRIALYAWAVDRTVRQFRLVTERSLGT